MDTNILPARIGEYLQQALCHYDLAGLLCGIRVGADSPLACAGLDENYALGFYHAEKQTPLKTSDATHFASVSKLFVATAALRLAGDERLKLDEYLATYLPDFRLADERYRDITIRHILSHTSGIPDIEDYHWREPELDEGALYRYAHSEEVRSLKLLGTPGAGQFKYSNIAFDVLGAALEKIMGISFDELMLRLFFAPLGMDASTFLTPARERSAHPLVRPHYKDAEHHIRMQDYFPYNRAHAPSSTLSSTLGDIKKWGDAWIGAAIAAGASGLPDALPITLTDSEAPVAALPSKRLITEALTPQAGIPLSNEKIGLGWFIRTQGGFTLYGHEGADDGFRSSFWMCPELRLQLTVLANLDKAPVKRISRRVFEMLTE